MAVELSRYCGAAFLIVYGAMNFRAALRGGEALDTENAAKVPGLRAALITCLMLTWLNPHVYLDTVVLLGGISSQHAQPLVFGAGATLASFVFFFSLGFGARLLRPVFTSPRAWQGLDVLVGLTMWGIAASLLLH